MGNRCDLGRWLPVVDDGDTLTRIHGERSDNGRECCQRRRFRRLHIDQRSATKRPEKRLHSSPAGSLSPIFHVHLSPISVAPLIDDPDHAAEIAIHQVLLPRYPLRDLTKVILPGLNFRDPLVERRRSDRDIIHSTVGGFRVAPSADRGESAGHNRDHSQHN
jgi:hypothetical protein